MEFPESAIKMIIENGTANPCKICRWMTPAPTDPTQGRCTVSRTTSGAIWQRLIRDLNNTTCRKFDKGQLSFRDGV